MHINKTILLIIIRLKLKIDLILEKLLLENPKYYLRFNFLLVLLIILMI